MAATVKEGYLTKEGGSFKSWKRRYFILKEGTLSYYKVKGVCSILPLIFYTQLIIHVMTLINYNQLKYN